MIRKAIQNLGETLVDTLVSKRLAPKWGHLLTAFDCELAWEAKMQDLLRQRYPQWKELSFHAIVEKLAGNEDQDRWSHE